MWWYAPLDMHHLTWCGINSLHSVNLILFTVLVHLILRISPHHSHHLRSHYLSLPRPFTPDLKLISFTNPFLHSHSYSFRTAFTDLNLYFIKGPLTLFVLVSFFWLRVLDKAKYLAFESTLNSAIVSYRIVMDRRFKRCMNPQHDTRAVMYSVKFADVCCRTEAWPCRTDSSTVYTWLVENETIRQKSLTWTQKLSD